VTSQPYEDSDQLERDQPESERLGDGLGSDRFDGDQAAEPGQQWHDIQATFVDDPRGSVQRAAEAVDTAVAALVDQLRERQSAMAAPDTATSASATDTEELREMLRTYRTFCQSLSDLGTQLPR
jgi:hypothetical protein